MIEAVAILEGTPRRILGVYRGGSAEGIRSDAASAHNVDRGSVAVLPTVLPRVAIEPIRQEETLRMLRRQFQRALYVEDGDWEDVASLVETYRRIRAAGGALPDSDVRAMEEFIKCGGGNEEAA